MKYCTNCGEKNKDNASFCVKCGKKLKINKSVIKSSRSSPDSNSNAIKGYNVKTIALTVLICFLFVGCVVVGGKLFFDTNAREESYKEAQEDLSGNKTSEEVEAIVERHESVFQTDNEDFSQKDLSEDTINADSIEEEKSINTTGLTDSYDELIEQYRQVMSVPYIDDQLESLMIEYPLLNFNLIQDAIINQVGLGYALVDINRDGIDELLINYMYNEQSVSEGDYYFSALYTQKNGQAIPLITDCAYRTVCYLCEDGAIVEYGSGGALYGIATVFRFNESGDGLILDREYEVDYEKDEDAPYYDGEERLTSEEFDGRYVKIDVSDLVWNYIG